MVEAFVGGSLLLLLILFLVGIVVYFVPTFIAIKRDHPQKLPIILVNIVFGATMIGWIAALVWSLMDDSSKGNQQ